jgi:hypothetical protein
MKRILSIKFLLLAFGTFALLAFSQDTLSPPPDFEVNRMRPFVSINAADLAEARTLLDINPRYDADWVKTYEYVQIETMQKGVATTAKGSSDELTAEQLQQLMSADLGSPITVKVSYMPENNLSHNDLQEMGFSFEVEPDVNAQFPGGKDQLQTYVTKTAIEKIPEGTYKGYDMSAVTFKVDENGFVTEVEAVEPLQDSAIEALLIDAVCNMPAWEPARFKSGKTVAQSFALTVGNQENCKIPLLNTRDL